MTQGLSVYSVSSSLYPT